jgi:hypothetical protein
VETSLAELPTLTAIAILGSVTQAQPCAANIGDITPL